METISIYGVYSSVGIKSRKNEKYSRATRLDNIRISPNNLLIVYNIIYLTGTGIVGVGEESSKSHNILIYNSEAGSICINHHYAPMSKRPWLVIHEKKTLLGPAVKPFHQFFHAGNKNLETVGPIFCEG